MPGMSRRLHTVWQNGGTAVGAFLFTRLDAVALEAIARIGFDYVCIDMQHGLMSFDDVLGMLQAVSAGDATPIVRVASNDPASIGRVLDAGALGVIIPMVNSPEEAARAVAACRYAPAGSRSYGPLRAAIAYGDGYAAEANRNVLCIPMIETAAAVACAEQIVAVPGVDAIYVGPTDLSLTYGLQPLLDNAGPFPDALQRIVQACTRNKIIAGIHSNVLLAAARHEGGFRMVTVSNDVAVLLSGFAADLGSARASTGGDAHGSPAVRLGY